MTLATALATSLPEFLSLLLTFAVGIGIYEKAYTGTQARKARKARKKAREKQEAAGEKLLTEIPAATADQAANDAWSHAYGQAMAEGDYDRAKELHRNRDQWMQDWKEQHPEAGRASEYERFKEDPDKYLIDPEESAMAQVEPSERSVEAQKQALERLQGTAGEFRDIYEQGGMDAITQAENARARRQAAMDARSQRQAALQQMQARGMGGSGAAYTAALQAGQGMSNQAAMARRQNLAEGRQRALQALQQSGQMGARAGELGGQMRGQSFRESGARASAIDAFNQYNTDYRRGLNRRDVGSQNQERWQRYGAKADAYKLKSGVAGNRAQQAQQELQRQKRRGEEEADEAQELVAGGLSAYYTGGAA